MTRIVTTTYRYKPPPKKRKAVAIAGGTGPHAAKLKIERMFREGTERPGRGCDATVAAPPAQPRAAAVGPDTADAPDACAASATPFQTAIAAAPVLRLVSTRPHLAGPGGQAGDPMSRAPPRRHWRSYGNDPLPTGREALDEPFAAFPSWFMRVTCERCGRERMFNEAHSSQRSMLIRDIIAKMRHDGCGGMAEKVELLSGIEGVSSRPVRRIVLREG